MKQDRSEEHTCYYFLTICNESLVIFVACCMQQGEKHLEAADFFCSFSFLLLVCLERWHAETMSSKIRK